MAHLEISVLAKLDAAELGNLFFESLPRVRGTGECKDDPEELKKLVRSRCTDNGITGKMVIALLIDNTKPGSKGMEKHETFIKLFEGTDDLFKRSATAVRGCKVFAVMVVNKLILANTSAAIGAAEDKVFKMVLEEFRLRDYDSFYPPGDIWCIQCGEQQPVRYDSKFGGKGISAGIHGFAVAPAGWIRFALNTSIIKPDLKPEVWTTWHKAYHGTSGVNVQAICRNGLRFMPTKHGAAGATAGAVIYASPCIEYSAHYLYTKDHKVEASGSFPISESLTSLGEGVFELEGSFVQFVFEVRVRPRSYRVQGNTLGGALWGDRSWDVEFDRYFNRKNLEWIIEGEEDIICTAVMLRDIGKSPREYNADRFQAMQKHVGWDGTQSQRPRNYGSFEGSPGRWEYNGSAHSTLSMSADQDWKAYSLEISEVIEGAYTHYQRFAYIGQPPGAPGPYFIDFGNECDPNIKEGPEQRRADPDKEQDWRRRAVRRVRAVG